jgi:hypothetical protein
MTRKLINFRNGTRGSVVDNKNEIPTSKDFSSQNERTHAIKQLPPMLEIAPRSVGSACLSCPNIPHNKPTANNTTGIRTKQVSPTPA